jgi:cystathionine beta-lyase/cystathionine gamma-synthase
MGIPESLVRYATGIEAVADLIADLDQALSIF